MYFLNLFNFLKALSIKIRTENFEEAKAIVDRYLKSNEKNLTALLLKADLEMAYGNVDKMKIYEDKAIAIDPNTFSNTKN
jgi:tetratricopeptide (TPR) repeat protein